MKDIDQGERGLIDSWLNKNRASYRWYRIKPPENYYSEEDMQAELLDIEKQTAECLNKSTNNLGTYHPDTLQARDQLLAIWRNNGQTVRADAYMKQVEICRKNRNIIPVINLKGYNDDGAWPEDKSETEIVVSVYHTDIGSQKECEKFMPEDSTPYKTRCVFNAYIYIY